jgi:hypothetical protein
VPTARIEVGARARVRDAAKMTDFVSGALKRTFPVVYFGTLDGARADGLAKGAATAAAGAEHAPPGEMPVQPVARASGPNGKTVAEIIQHRADLKGKTVRVHGTVVKATAGVLGKTYLHLRDGSGDHNAGTDDLVVTTTATPEVGETVLIEGVVAIDRDIGSGYRFDTLVDDAKILAAP